jgi:uncharacterized membrane protein
MTRICKQCGAAATQTARFCNKCGVQLASTESSQGETNPTVAYQTSAKERPDHGPSAYQPPSQAGYDSPATNVDLMKPQIAAMLCYPLFFITGIIFLVLKPYKKDPFVRFHAYQSIFFTVGLVALNIMVGIASIILPEFLEDLLATGLGVIALGGTIWMMYQAYLGKRAKLPLIGDMAENRQ